MIALLASKLVSLSRKHLVVFVQTGEWTDVDWIDLTSVWIIGIPLGRSSFARCKLSLSMSDRDALNIFDGLLVVYQHTSNTLGCLYVN